MLDTYMDPTIYATGLAYSTTCSVKPVPINLFTKVRRTPHPNGISDGLDVLKGWYTAVYAVLSDGDTLVLADEPKFNALLWNSFLDIRAPFITEPDLIMILRNSREPEEIPFLCQPHCGGPVLLQRD